MKISYISNIKLSESSGGMSGINHAVYHQLKRFFNVENYIYINAKEDQWAKIKSKALRVLGLKGNYPFFSNKRLNEIDKRFQGQKKSCDAYFFFGFTSWIDIGVTEPYFCYNDASFATYVAIYNNKSEFSEKDLNRIYDKEKKWLQNAQLVFFNSDWAIEETKKAYGLTGENFINIGFGGFINIPSDDSYQEGYNFLFISREFVPKGGYVVAKALQIVRQHHPRAKVWVVGDAPPEDLKNQHGLEYLGFFSKSKPIEKQRLLEIFSKSFCLVHPTLKDTTTLVITESAYYGCPAIASNRFAIPEFIEDGITGLFIENPRDAHEVAQKMIYLIEHPEPYKQMRQAVRAKALEHYTWDRVGEQFHHYIRS
jgi:glycosyltransferase involved in cell wall biosynthesis